VSEAGVEELLDATIDTAVQTKAVRVEEFERIIVDPTVWEQAIAHILGIILREVRRKLPTATNLSVATLSSWNTLLDRPSVFAPSSGKTRTSFMPCMPQKSSASVNAKSESLKSSTARPTQKSGLMLSANLPGQPLCCPLSSGTVGVN